jgi:Uma2 family endonuclease
VVKSSNVKAILHLSRRAAYADYLAAEQNSARRHEFIDGVIVAMAGGSDEHNALTSRMVIVCGPRLLGPCRHYSPDQRFWIAATGRGRYSDGSIICGKPEHPVHDDQATTNPVVVIEVLSPSTEGDDAGDKRADFCSLASLQAYVLVSQDARRVVVYRRGADGGWRGDADVYAGDQAIDLPTLTHAIPLAEIFDGILDAGGRSVL